MDRWERARVTYVRLIPILSQGVSLLMYILMSQSFLLKSEFLSSKRRRPRV